MLRILIVLPTYNERENIAPMLEALLALPDQVDVLVVDDNSPDGTWQYVEQYMASHPEGRVHLLHRAGKQGLRSAYLAGFQWGLERNYDHLCEIDCDFSHNPEDVTRLVAACEEQHADLAIGSRYVSGVNVVNWPMGRIIMSYCASVYVRCISGMPVRDATAGFVCYRGTALARLLRHPIRMKGYGFQIEMKYVAYRMGLKIVEVPIIFTDRKRGTSKMSGGIFSEALCGVIRMRFGFKKSIKNES
ncbi:MAG: polyprenol monophosphomannose synthase [Bacteroides sp.]